jgi:D-xylose transport system permease protein
MEKDIQDTQSQTNQESLSELWHGLVERLAHGDIGSLPVALGLILIAIIFQIANPNFLTPLNLTNLMVQISAVGTISVGVVLVLLIGEIDLSVGAVSGFSAAIMAVLSVKMGLPGIVAILAGVLTGALIGLFQGGWFAKLHVPSFVVTLAGFLGWQGALLYVLGSSGTINLNDPLIIGLANQLLPVWLGWAVGIGFVIIYAFNLFRQRGQRIRLNLQTQPIIVLIARIILVAVLIGAAVGLMSVNRNPGRNVVIQGVPMGVVFLLLFVILFDFITKRTKFGRFVFAVGGNAEAGRRAGINVDRIRIYIFTLGSLLAACGGILAASRLYAVNQSSGSGDVLLNAIAAAVIGGTSLFGGRGSTWSALLGALVIGSIANGMDLLALASSVRFMVTGAVLLLAVTLDAYTRARRQQTGAS